MYGVTHLKNTETKKVARIFDATDPLNPLGVLYVLSHRNPAT